MQQPQPLSERIDGLFKSKLRVTAFDLLAVTQEEVELFSWEFSKALWRVFRQFSPTDPEYQDALDLIHIIRR